MYGECEFANPECKYYFRESVSGGNVDNGCYSDTDHIYGRAKNLGKIAREFCLNVPDNKRQICRAEHDEINATYVHQPLPDLETMKQIIEERKQNGG